MRETKPVESSWLRTAKCTSWLKGASISSVIESFEGEKEKSVEIELEKDERKAFFTVSGFEEEGYPYAAIPAVALTTGETGCRNALYRINGKTTRDATRAFVRELEIRNPKGLNV